MERIKVSENFFLDEYIDPYTYFNTKDNGLSLMDPKIFSIVQKLRELKGSFITINNWWYYYILNRDNMPIREIIKNIEDSGFYKWSGWRSDRTNVGSSKSAHRVGKAADPKGDQNELFKLVKDNAKCFYFMGLRRLEDPSITNGWLHLDTLERNTKPNSIRVVNLTDVTQTITW